MILSSKYLIIKRLLLIFTLAAALSCSENVDIHTKAMEETYLVVDGILTDETDVRQCIRLSESIAYFDTEAAPAVKGARVTVEGENESISFVEEDEGSGEYLAPEGWSAVPGHSYHLKIEAFIDGQERSYEAVSTMGESGFDLFGIDCIYSGDKTLQLDSLWTVLIWGKDKETIDYYLVTIEVNGHAYPLDATMAIDDLYFNGSSVEAFPIGMLYQNADNYKTLGECAKYLEKGDEITVRAFTLKRDFYDFFNAFLGNSNGAAIPLLASQPASPPTNIHGGPVMGWFAVCPATKASVTIDDPLRSAPKH